MQFTPPFRTAALALSSAAFIGISAPLGAQQKTGIKDRAAQDAQKKPVPTSGWAVIDGTVTDTLLRPLGSADVSVVGVAARVVTSDNGRFRFLQVPAGQYLLVVRRIGYAPTSGIIEVPSTDTLRLAYTLARATNLLDTVRIKETRISMRMKEFDERRLAGVGQFITQEQIEKRGSREVGDYLRTLASIEVSRITSQAFAGTVALSRREGGSIGGDVTGACPMQVLLDGIVLPKMFNLELLPPPKQVAGIEVYSGPATIPPQFGGPDRRCGMILVWTREGY